MLRRIIVSLVFVTLMTAVAACSEHLARCEAEDTGDNLRTTGNAISK